MTLHFVDFEQLCEAYPHALYKAMQRLHDNGLVEGLLSLDIVQRKASGPHVSTTSGTGNPSRGKDHGK